MHNNKKQTSIDNQNDKDTSDDRDDKDDKDAKDDKSDHDFGKNIIPNMLNTGLKLQAYRFKGYWRDVGTLSSLHEANMDLLDDPDALDIYNNFSGFKIYTEDTKSLPQYIGPDAIVKDSMINQGSLILGNVNHSIIFTGVVVLNDSIIFLAFS